MTIVPRPTLALDATYAADRNRTGTGVYSWELIAALASLPELRRQVEGLLLCFRPGSYLRRARRHAWPAGCRTGVLWEPWILPRRAALFHGLNQRLPQARFPARVVTIHDVFPLSSADYSTPEFQRRFSGIIRHAVRTADRIIAVSNATREQLLQHADAADERIRVVHHGLRAASPPALDDTHRFLRERLQIEPHHPFFLSVGTIQTRKNIANIVLAARQAGARLVIAGGDGYGAERVHELIRRENMEQRVIRLGHASADDLRHLYSAATALVFASLEEGFGLPILEAMSYGLPVITSNCSAMPEVGGDAALYVDPRDVSQIAQAMARVRDDLALADQLRRLGKQRAAEFTWELCARRTWQVYEELLGG